MYFSLGVGILVVTVCILVILSTLFTDVSIVFGIFSPLSTSMCAVGNLFFRVVNITGFSYTKISVCDRFPLAPLHQPCTNKGACSFFKSSLDNIMIIAMLLWIVDCQLVTALSRNLLPYSVPSTLRTQSRCVRFKAYSYRLYGLYTQYGGNTSSIPVWRL